MDRRKTLTYACASQDLHIHTHSFLSESEVKGNTVDEAATLMFVLKKKVENSEKVWILVRLEKQCELLVREGKR